MIPTPLALADPHAHSTEATGADPSRVYQTFIAAIVARDLPRVLTCMTGEYGRDLSQHYRKGHFHQFFQLWCETYPLRVDVVAWFIDGDTATLEVEDEIDGVVVTSHVGLAIESGLWRVAWERFAVERKRMNLATTKPPVTAHAIQPGATHACPQRRVGDRIGGDTGAPDSFPQYATR